MYRRIGEIVSRRPILWIVFWIVFAAIAINIAPSRESVWKDGEFIFLPEDSPSRRAAELFQRAFPSNNGDPRFSDDSVGTSIQQDPLGSNIVIVLQREDRPSGLTEQDKQFISQTLLDKLEEIRETTPRGYSWSPELEAELTEPLPAEAQVIRGISTLADPRIGALLTSRNEKSTLVVIELKTEFLDRQNALVLGRIENLVNDPEIQQERPLGLSANLSGSATVGRDMLRAEQESASRTETFTKILIIILLLLIYRAPLLALVPLVTVGVAVELSQSLLRILAGLGLIDLFTGLDVYVTVVVYGAGVDYCLFLIARYKEELDLGNPHRLSMANSIHRVGAALATSAGTSIVGIGMMGFSEFGKFRQAGFAISFGLLVVLCFALTFTPSFLLIFGRWAFWPDVRREKVGEASGWLPSSSMWTSFQEQRLLEQIWDGVANLLRRRPATVFALAILAMMPFAVVGTVFQENLSYGLLTDLPQDEPSVRGAKVVQKHFPAGITGPMTMLIHFDPEVLKEFYDGKDLSDLRTAEQLSEQISLSLQKHEQEARDRVEQAARTNSVIPPDERPIGIEDIRSQYFPLGTQQQALAYFKSLPARQRAIGRNFAHKTYTSLRGDLAGEVMRLDLVLNIDPFSRESIEQLGRLEKAIEEAIPLGPDDLPADQRDKLQESAEVLPLGTTGGIRDLKSVTDRDRIRIDILVIVSVYIVLVLLLRQPRICAYLIVSVVFSYLVALGATFAVFYLRDPQGFTGIDWKVPVYLFTILIAMGEDYNILLMARVTEEQEQHGRVNGILVALKKTGSIISSCGVIMAGTFLSLMAGTLLGMVQLGFALAFGVLLDTFVVRPILVPAYLILLYSGRFGKIGRLLGAPKNAGEETQLA